MGYFSIKFSLKKCGSCLCSYGGRVVKDGCMQCGKSLTYNEVGAYKKFVNRGSRQFLCKACLAGKLDVTVEDIDRRIEQFKAQGCTLFV